VELPSLGGGRRGASARRLSENGGIDAPPFISEVGAIRQTIVEQHSQFLSLERVERFVRVRPPPNGSPRKTAQAQPIASAVIGEDFEGSPGTIAENEHNARERILSELSFTQCGERIDTFSKVDRFAGKQNLELRNELLRSVPSKRRDAGDEGRRPKGSLIT
jgi:hypothetical protein